MKSRDPFSPEERSEVMSSIGSVDTEPEILLRKELWNDGLRYRLHRRVAGTTPDVVFVGPKVAVFVDGCFWHGCPDHYTAPRHNAEFWATKLEKNQNRDERDNRRLEDSGWTVIRVWECEVKSNLASVVENIKGAIVQSP